MASLAWVYSEIKRKGTKVKDTLKSADELLKDVIEEDTQIGENYKTKLKQLINVENARIHFIKKKPGIALEILTETLKLGEHFCLRIRRATLELIREIFEDYGKIFSFG
jgi:hypothetical protein